MIFESKRLLELAGIKSDESSNILTEGLQNESLDEFSSNDGVTEVDREDGTDEGKSCGESEDEIREAVRQELESMWSSGQVFGKKSKSRSGEVTMGFSGVGFKK